MEKVAIVGHSFVRRLREFLDDHPEKDRHFGMDRRRVHLLDCGGIKMFDVRKTFEEKIQKLNPDWVIVVLGDNDVNNKRFKMDGLATMIIEVAFEYLRSRDIPVVITNLMPRYRGDHHWAGWFKRSYNKRASVVNEEIRLQLQSGLYPQASFWNHKFAVFPTDEASTEEYWANRHLFCPDGVHLSEDGYFRYYRSLSKLLNGLRRQ